MAGAFIDLEGAPEAIATFLSRLESDAPPLCVIERVETSPLAPSGGSGFVISPSDPAGSRRALVSADTATCADCLAELFDPADRRYLYPFINCTNCGPRFTIVRDVPYDRPNTTMAGFGMCADCEREYSDPDDRRYHAQPTCCPVCGPVLSLVDAAGARSTTGTGPPSAMTGRTGTGSGPPAPGPGRRREGTGRLSPRRAGVFRKRRRRAALAQAAGGQAFRGDGPRHAHGPAALPDGRARNNVSWRAPAGPSCSWPAGPPQPSRPAAAGIAPSVAPGNRQLGLMLPYTPVHHLLARALGEPFVLTSGNISDEPIAFLDDEARARLERHRRRLPHPRPAHPRAHRRLGHALAARRRHPAAAVPGVRAPTAARCPGSCSARCWRAAPS